MQITVAIDCMGGDHGPRVTVPAAINFLSAPPDARAILVGLENEVAEALKQVRGDIRDRITLRHATEVVHMA